MIDLNQMKILRKVIRKRQEGRRASVWVSFPSPTLHAFSIIIIIILMEKVHQLAAPKKSTVLRISENHSLADGFRFQLGLCYVPLMSSSSVPTSRAVNKE